MADNGQRPKLNVTLGTTGLKQYSGIIDEEFLPRLRGMNGIRLYTEMQNNCPAIAASLNIIDLLIRQVEWRIEPADESDAAKEQAEDVEFSLFEDMSHTFEDFVSEILSMLSFGYAPFEITYKQRRGPSAIDPRMRSKRSDGKWSWRKIEIRSQETVDHWELDEEGGIQGLIQQDTYAPKFGTVFIPIEKMLLFRTRARKNNPEGASMLRPCVVPYWYIKRIQEIEAIGVERNLAGMPVMEVPAEILIADASKEDVALRRELEKFVTQIKADERWGGLVPSELRSDGMPSGYKLKLMQASSKSVMDTDTIIRRYETRIFQIFLTQFLTMGTDKVGSYSLSDNMTSLFATAIGTIMDDMTAIMNRFMIPRRQRLNGYGAELDPTIKHGDIEGRDLAQLSNYVQSLMASGALQPSSALERELLLQAKLPEPDVEERDAALPADLPAGTQAAIDGIIASDETTQAIDPTKALNGAQVTALVTLLQEASSGSLPTESVKEIILASFPIEEGQVDRILAPIIARGIKKPDTVPA